MLNGILCGLLLFPMVLMGMEGAEEKSQEEEIWGELPHDIQNSTQITNLIIRHSSFTALPDSLLKLTNLTALNISDACDLTALPEDLKVLRSLRSLSLIDNKKIIHPNNIIPILQLTALTYLNLSGNNLIGLPKEFGTLSNLVHLFLTENSIFALPPSITQCQQLETLWVDRNSLRCIPDLSGCTRLQVLDLCSNTITTLGESLGSLPNLRTLRVAGNNLDADSMGLVEGINSRVKIVDALKKTQTAQSTAALAAVFNCDDK